jgi:hypothetical protein
MGRKGQHDRYVKEQQDSLNKILKLGHNGVKKGISLTDYFNALQLLDLDSDPALKRFLYLRIVEGLKEVDGVDKQGNRVYKYQRHYPLVIDPDLERDLVKMRCGLVEQLREWNINAQDKKRILELLRNINEDSPLNMNTEDLCGAIKNIIILWTLDTDKDLLSCNNKLKKLWTDPKLSKYVTEILPAEEFEEFVKRYTLLQELTSRWFDPRLYTELVETPNMCSKTPCQTKVKALRALADIVRKEAKNCEKLVSEYESRARHLYVSKEEQPSLFDRIIDIFYV